ncbi:MAG: hypothetical protein EOO73_22635 [Myxococcales bacterium]|nr:MAG: hypothetical protein EOO73_22635 [Myxococcales bacterium]
MHISRSPDPRKWALVTALVVGTTGCDDGAKTPALSLSEGIVRNAPVPPENGPQLGVVSKEIQVREYSDPGAPSLGALRAGSRVARSAEPVSHKGCAGGWYAVRPRGFVCVGAEATLDLKHPTLAAMALAPQRDAELPYTYARAKSETPLFERVVGEDDSVREVGRLHRRAGMAVVGSWRAKEPGGADSRLALLTDGRFVRASDLEAAKPSDFEGVELGKRELPLAFVVKRGVRTFRINDGEAEKGDLLEYHAELPLTGRFRTLGKTKYWAYPGRGEELWVRHQDVTVVQKRTAFPEFVRDQTRWLDVSVTAGTLVAYEGKRATFATLLSVARELPETETETRTVSDLSIPLGTSTVRSKALSTSLSAPSFGEPFEVADVPWALELSSGQLLHGAYWHDRFGIEHGAGTLALSPRDAARVFRFLGPELPPGWHAVALPPEQGARVVLRK